LSKIGQKNSNCSLLFQKTLENIPSNIETIRIDTPKDSPGDFFIQSLDHKEQKFVVKLNVSSIRKFDKKDVALELKECNENLLKQDYQLLYVNNSTYSKVEDEYSELMTYVWNTPVDIELSEKKHEEFPVERVRGMFEHIGNAGGIMHVFLVQEISSKKLVGLTQFVINKSNPRVVEQSFTAVLPEHRGRGIGYTLKLNSLNYLLNTDKAEYWITANAQLNENMIKINNKLGYEEWTQFNVYEIHPKDFLENNRSIKKV
jgi:GNAT superfamily N-acetyltransferase